MKDNDSDFVRDERSNALINTNVRAYQAYKQHRQTITVQSEQEKEIISLRSELAQMKDLLQALIREKNG